MRESTTPLVARLGEEIGTSKVTIAVAESCTGGMLCGAIIADPDVSGALERGFVVYSPEAKCDLLGLDRKKVEACNGVSKEVAIDMAQAALDRSQASMAVAITGFAGPREENEEVGLVHFAIATRNGSPVHREQHFGDLGRETVCRHAVQTALEMLIDAVRHERDDATA